MLNSTIVLQKGDGGMISDVVEMLGGDERAVRIARKLLQLTMWCSAHELRWLTARIQDVVEVLERVQRAA
jgi:hypothetical protein